MVGENRSTQVSDPQQGTTVCWECDTPVARPITVSLPLSPGQCVALGLCVACYQGRYVQLLREIVGDCAVAR